MSIIIDNVILYWKRGLCKRKKTQIYNYVASDGTRIRFSAIGRDIVLKTDLICVTISALIP